MSVPPRFQRSAYNAHERREDIAIAWILYKLYRSHESEWSAVLSPLESRQLLAWIALKTGYRVQPYA